MRKPWQPGVMGSGIAEGGLKTGRHNWPIKLETDIGFIDKKRNAINSNKMPFDLA